jgi:hypothetical protein
MQYIATSILCLVMLIGADAFAMSKMDTFRAFRPADPIREVGCSFVLYYVGYYFELKRLYYP